MEISMTSQPAIDNSVDITDMYRKGMATLEGKPCDMRRHCDVT